MKNDRTLAVEPHLKEALLDLLHADEAFIRSYHAWLTAPTDEERERQRALDEAERRVDEARREAARWKPHHRDHEPTRRGP